MPLWRAMRSRNACKTCALGMGGQMGGMVNEAGHFPEVCKKSLQAMASDMQNRVSPDFFSRYSISQLRTLSPRELESCGRLVAPVYAGAGETHYRVIAWDEALDRLAANCGHRSPAQLLLLEWPLVERSWIPPAAVRAGVRDQRRQQLLLLLSPGERRGLGLEPRNGHGDRSARGPRAQRSLLTDRRQPSLESSAPASELDDDASPWRQRHRDQSGARDRSRQLPRAKRPVELGVRNPDCQHLCSAAHRRRYCAAHGSSQTSAGTRWSGPGVRRTAHRWVHGVPAPESNQRRGATSRQPRAFRESRSIASPRCTCRPKTW